MFPRKYGWLNKYIPWILGPLLGHTPTSFAAHHMAMHHAENNMAGDGSCTLAYRRDSFPQFMHYWARFFFTGEYHLVRYLRLRDRDKAARSFLAGEVSWLAVTAFALWLNWAAALVVFVIPLLMMRWLLMCGNFAQHAFVDVTDPDNGFKNSNNLINTPFNHLAYNDGYHIVHHNHPSMHWTEMAQYYEDHIDEFAENDCVVFDGLGDNIVLWFFLMTQNYDKLARHLVDFHGRTHEEKIAFLKGRVRTTVGERPSMFHSETAEEAIRTRRRANAA